MTAVRALPWLVVLLAACVGDEPGPTEVPDQVWDDDPVDEGPTYRWEEIGLSAEAASTLGRWGFMTADRGDGTAIVFGGTRIDGFADGDSFGDTWFIDARAEAPVFSRLQTTGNPDPRYCGCMSYDPARDLVILVGGRDVGMLMPETWLLDLATNTWTLVDPMSTTTPPGVVACAMSYSADRDATYLFGGMGGEDGTDAYDRTWRFDADARTWTELETVGPSARFSSILTQIGTSGPLLMFGGAPTTFGVEYLADIWRFDALTETWSPLVVDGPAPRGRREAWLAVEPAGGGFIIGMGVAGVQTTDALSDLWRFDFATRRWTDITPSESPVGRGYSLYLPGGPGRIGLLLGGFDNLEPVADLHRLVPPDGDTHW
ncbi:MAG: hypothetical protein HYY06_23330 [Deltaproteobacteria bacterium]|nr:hypothetical protein [Deltaproteobacteria bacterium]